MLVLFMTDVGKLGCILSMPHIMNCQISGLLTCRQKYWSRMTGFQFGRKLGDWGKEDDPADQEQVGSDSSLSCTVCM